MEEKTRVPGGTTEMPQETDKGTK